MKKLILKFISITAVLGMNLTPVFAGDFIIKDGLKVQESPSISINPLVAFCGIEHNSQVNQCEYKRCVCLAQAYSNTAFSDFEIQTCKMLYNNLGC